MNTLEQVKAIIGDKVGFATDMIMDDAWLGPRDPKLALGRQFLSLDSLDRLELAQQIEEHFDIEISDAQTDKPEMGTPAGIAEYVDSALFQLNRHDRDVDTPAETDAAQTPADSAWQPGDTLRIHAAEDAATYPATLDPNDWADKFCISYDGQSIDPGGEGQETKGLTPSDIVEWFRAAIQAGYSAARPLDPNRIIIGDASHEERQSNLVDHARRELAMLGDGEDSDQAELNEHIIGIIRRFADEGHSGSSAGYTAAVIRRLMAFEPLAPLTGEDDEWTEVSEGIFQNKRCSHVFKSAEAGYAYDINVAGRPEITFPYRVHMDSHPIDREELLRRGFDETLDGSILATINALGFPTTDNPLGTDPTHRMVPIVGELEGAPEPLPPLESVQFLRIEPMKPIDRIHFAVEIEDMPEWLMEAIGKETEAPGAVWADQGVLFVRTPEGTMPVKPGQLIRHAVIDQLTIEDSPIS